MNDEPLEHRVEITVPAESEVGEYASFASVWRSRDCFILDFATEVRPPEMVREPDSAVEYVHIPARVVSRVRIPADQVWELMKALEQNLSAYERETGRRPGAS